MSTRLYRNFPIINILYKLIFSYPAPASLNYNWNYGVYAIFFLAIQVITGIFLAIQYTPQISYAISSVERIIREVEYGWLLRYVHANVASIFFIAVYVHIFRGLYYGSFIYPRQILWTTGVIIFLLIIITAFLGYVLPWGQISFWAATVITNIVTIIPWIGREILEWIWGGFAINNATLNRFFSFHYLLPFVLIGLVGIHIILLHESGSNNPVGSTPSESNSDKISFNPYYTIKDANGIFIIIIFSSYFIFFAPNILGHTDNYIAANPLVTPPHIVPEWYLLPFYAILRSIPEKVSGILAILLAILILLIVPFIFKPEKKSISFRPFSKNIFYIFILNALILGWVATKPIISPYYKLGQFTTIIYFCSFIIIFPLAIIFENFLNNNKYISEK